MNNTTPQNETIDAVVTWVDGNDPTHRSKRALAQCKINENNLEHLPAGTVESRFLNNNEIYYCLHSIRLNAPWINNIYLVTDDQRPDFLSKQLAEQLNVKLIDHKEIFCNHENFLPTFNSISIESAIYKIKGLSNKFIYLNDDFIITRPVTPETFFKSSSPVLHGDWNRLQNFSRPRLWISQKINKFAKKAFGIDRAMSALQQIKGAQLAGFKDRYFRTPHRPHPIIKKTIGQFYKENRHIYEANISHPFRNTGQHTMVSLANHLELIKETAITNNHMDSLMICFHRDSSEKIDDKLKAMEREINSFLCIQSWEQANDVQSERIKKFLDRTIILAYHTS